MLCLNVVVIIAHAPMLCYHVLCVFSICVRRVSTINAANELPTTAEEALLLWIFKVSEAVMCSEGNTVLQVYTCRVLAQLYCGENLINFHPG